MGWLTGLEPATPGTTIRCSNQLSYNHHKFKEPRQVLAGRMSTPQFEELLGKSGCGFHGGYFF